MTGIFLILGIFSLISLLDFTLDIFKNLILKGSYSDLKINTHGPNDQENRGYSNKSLPSWIKNCHLGVDKGFIVRDPEGNRIWGAGGDDGDDDKDLRGMGPLYKSNTEMLKGAIKILHQVWEGFVINAYVTYYGYNSEGNEINPQAMQTLRWLGIFERYGIHDRLLYPDIRNVPYPLSNSDNWYHTYLNALIVVLDLQPDYEWLILPGISEYNRIGWTPNPELDLINVVMLCIPTLS